MKIVELDKSKKDSVLPGLFDILHSNMSRIAPSGKSYEDELSFWMSCVSPALDKEPRKILLIYDGCALAGFLQYFVNGSLFMIEEIQLCERYHRTSALGELYAYLAEVIPEDTQLAEAYAHKSNHRSIAILNHLGLEAIGETDDGSLYHFRGRYENIPRYKGILKKYGKKRF